MYTTSAEYKKAIKEGSRAFECRVTILDKVYKNEDIVDIIIDGNIQPSDGFMIGATTSKALDLTLLNKGDIVYGSSTIKVEIGLKIGSKIEYIPMGIYNIDDIEKTDYTVKITAFDNMIKFEKNFTTNLGDALTLQQIVNELARITGVQFTGSVPAYTVKKLEGFSCREVLGYVASICGGNAVITRDGKFTIVTPKDINYSIGTANYFDYKREETKYKIGKISCQVGEKVLSKGSLGADSMELEFENPWITDSILQNIYNKLNGFEYLGYSMKWQGDLSLDVGDIVTITDKKGVVRKHPILSQKFTYTGGLTSEIEAKGENKNKNSFSSSGSVAKKIDRIVTELAIVNKALVDVAYIRDLTAGNIKFDTASGTIMDLQTLLAKHITGENGQFLNITTDNVTISDAVIKDIIAANISVGDLKAGKISTNKFTVASENGGIEIAGNTQQFKDKNGKVRIQMGQDTKGNFNFILRGADGTTTLIDHTGIKEKAIADGLIKNDMIGKGEIGGEKINISSLITEINKDNTQTLKASRIAFDSTGQSLDIAFNSLKSNVDNMEIGGRNLQTNANFNKPLSGTWRYVAKNMSINEDVLCDGYKSVKILRTDATTTTNAIFLYTGAGVIPAKYEDEFTMSFEYYIPETPAQEIDGLFSAGVYFYKDKGVGAGSKRVDLAKEKVKGKWTKVVVTGKATDIDTKSVAFVIGFNKNCEVYISKPKLERGNKATDFTDTDDKIEANTTAISVVQGSIKTLIKDTTIEKDGKEVKLKDAYSTLNQTVSSINKTVGEHSSTMNGLETRVKSAEEKITSDAIVNTVKDHKTNGVNTFATTSEVKQTTDAWVAKFNSSGGYNLLKNSAFANKNIDNWWVWGGVSRWTDTSYYKEVGDMYILNTDINNPGGLWQSEIPMKPNTTYTFSVRCHKEKNVKGGRFGLEYQSSPNSSVIAYTTIELNFDDQRHSYTFTTPNNPAIKYAKVGFRHDGAISSGGHCLIKINKPCLAEGEIAVWSPNPFEIKDGSTIIDADGVKIYNGALTVLNNAGEAMLQADGNGNLTFKGKLQPNDYQLKLFGNECKIDGSANAIRMQLTPQIYSSMDSNGGFRIFNQHSNNGARYTSILMAPDGHSSMYNDRSRIKLLGAQNARPVIQSRNSGDNAYGDFHGADFLNRSTIKDKTNVEDTKELDCTKIVLENNIFKYNLKTDVENILEKFGLDSEYNLDEVVGSSADGRVGFILEELTEEAKALLSPGDMESISIYSMCSILWKAFQEQQKRIEVLESLLKQ